MVVYFLNMSEQHFNKFKVSRISRFAGSGRENWGLRASRVRIVSVIEGKGGAPQGAVPRQCPEALAREVLPQLTAQLLARPSGAFPCRGRGRLYWWISHLIS